MYNDILGCILEAEEKNIPSTAPPSRKIIPGWKEHVEHYKKVALYWHQCWKDEGRPHQGETSHMCRVTRAQYHRVIKIVKRNDNQIKMNKMAEALTNNNTRDLFAESRRLKGRNSNLPKTVDDATNDEDISTLFAKKSKYLYNSVSYNKDDMDKIKNNVNNSLERSTNDDYIVSVLDVVKAVEHLKHGKGDGYERLSSDNLINAPHSLFVMLTLVYNAMLVHGVSPESMILGTMVPIPKNRRQSLADSNNYRTITLSSIIGKAFDWVILLKESDTLSSSDLQFGFKEGVSTTQCSFVMLETISHYNYNGSNVNVLLLDATKAFDRIHYCKLFSLLIERGMNPLLIRLLIFMYTNQKLRVRWGDHTSPVFDASNGVKQGGVLSPILFAVYVDGLFNRLKKSGVGCQMGNYFIGCILFADDVTLICPTIKGLRKMVAICEQFADEFNVKFNGTKSKLLIYKGKGCNIGTKSINVNGDIVHSSESADHLGHRISVKDKDSMISAGIASFWKAYNIFMSDFGSVYSFLKCKLFQQYCCSFYGANLWLLNSNRCMDICVAWRKALRQLWRIPYRTHNRLVALLSGTLPLEMGLERRFVKFAKNVLSHDTGIIRSVAFLSLYNPWSTFNRNYRLVQNSYGSCINVSDVTYVWRNSLKDEELADVSVIKEVIDVRDGYKHCELSHNEILLTIEILCTE